MNNEEREALEHVAAGDVQFHTGAWGCSAGYRWRGQDGCGGGVVPWEHTLEQLQANGLITTKPRRGPLERGVAVTPVGLAMLRAQSAAA